jgi:hypothetical protein
VVGLRRVYAFLTATSCFSFSRGSDDAKAALLMSKFDDLRSYKLVSPINCIYFDISYPFQGSSLFLHPSF